jgi:hypothetical protein
VTGGGVGAAGCLELSPQYSPRLLRKSSTSGFPATSCGPGLAGGLGVVVGIPPGVSDRIISSLSTSLFFIGEESPLPVLPYSDGSSTVDDGGGGRCGAFGGPSGACGLEGTANGGGRALNVILGVLFIDEGFDTFPLSIDRVSATQLPDNPGRCGFGATTLEGASGTSSIRGAGGPTGLSSCTPFSGFCFFKLPEAPENMSEPNVDIRATLGSLGESSLSAPVSSGPCSNDSFRGSGAGGLFWILWSGERRESFDGLLLIGGRVSAIDEAGKEGTGG